MIELRHRHGATLRVGDDEQAKFWEGRGYARVESESRPAPIKKAAARKPAAKK